MNHLPANWPRWEEFLGPRLISWVVGGKEGWRVSKWRSEHVKFPKCCHTGLTLSGMRVIEKNSYSVVIKKPCPNGRNRENFFVFVTFYTVGISGGCASVCNAPRRFSYMPYFYCFFDIIHSAGPIFLNSSFVVRWIYVVYLVPDIATHLFASRAHWDKHKSYLHHANDYTIVSRGREQPTLRRILAVKSHIRRCRSSPKTRAAQNWPKLPDPSLSPLGFQW